MVQSSAHSLDNETISNLFAVGDRVRHPKFGAGTVREISGYGASARIIIAFDRSGERTLSLAIAPIVRMEDEE